MLRLLILIGIVGALVPRAFAQTLPDLGDGAGGVLPPLVERKIGESIVREIRARDPTYIDDPEVADYLTELGSRLSAAIPGVRQEFEFLVIRDSSINAFALPGGFIGVHTGLLMASESESEVASVLAHEMAHVTQRHIARMLSVEKQAQLPAMIAMAAALVLGRSRPDLAQAAAMAAQGAVVQTQLGYSRDYEREADRIGFQTLASAGFDTQAMAAFFEKMQRYTRVVDDGSVPGYLRTHPITTERIADAQGRASQQPYRQYLDSIDYHLVRAKLRAESGDVRDAVTHFRTSIRDRRFANEPSASYGMVVALLRARQLAEAAAELRRLRASGISSPLVVALAARVHSALGETALALEALRQGLERWPYRRALALAYAEALDLAARPAEAVAHIEAQLRRYPRDLKLHELRAKSYAALGKRLRQHQAQAEFYVLRGSLPAAIDQLQLAQKSGDGDFYELSAVEARLKELRTEHAREVREQRKR